MNNQVIRTDKAPAPVGPYNQAIAAPGPFLFVAGQIPLDPVTGEIVSGEISTQTEQVMANLEGILTAAGANWSNDDTYVKKAKGKLEKQYGYVSITCITTIPKPYQAGKRNRVWVQLNTQGIARRVVKSC